MEGISPLFGPGGSLTHHAPSALASPSAAAAAVAAAGAASARSGFASPASGGLVVTGSPMGPMPVVGPEIGPTPSEYSGMSVQQRISAAQRDLREAQGLLDHKSDALHDAQRRLADRTAQLEATQAQMNVLMALVRDLALVHRRPHGGDLQSYCT